MNNRPALAALVSLTLLAASASAQTPRTIRWAALGDNVTAAGYPARLDARGLADSVISYGFGGGTALKSGDSSYWTSGRLAEVFAYQPDIVSIQLGMNDSKPVNWDDSANFARDYGALIDTLSSMPSQPRIIVVYPTPVWKDEEGAGEDMPRGSVIANSIVPTLRSLAAEKGADTANLHAPFVARQNLFPDSIAPSAAGNDSLGRHLFRAYVDQSLRVMCVGNSITFGHGVNSRQAYPVILNKLLGKKYWVWNGGKSGWWMQRAQLPGASGAYKSYVTDTPLMDTLFTMKPHFITVKLGTNDARQNFWDTPRFVADYRHFIDTLYDNMTPKPQFILLKPFPAWRVNGNWAFANGGYTAAENGINGDIIQDSLVPALDTVALSRNAKVAAVVDLHTPFLLDSAQLGANGSSPLAPDGVHPNAAGLDSVARIIYREILPVVTSILPAGDAVRRVPGPAPRASVRVHTGGRLPDWAQGARVFAADGKAVRPDASGALPPGIYLVRPGTGARETGR